MLVVFDSLMGKTEKFVRKLGLPSVKITEGLLVDEAYVLVTYTTGKAEVPKSTSQFLESNYSYLIGVASSGHPNWGKEMYAKAGDKIAEKYGVSLVHKFTMSGYESDVKIFLEGVSKLYGESIIPRTQ